MKNLIIIFLLVFSYSCTKKESLSSCVELEYETIFSLTENTSYCLPDGIEIITKEFIDGRCPCTADCIWEGEFVFNLTVISEEVEIEYVFHELLLEDNLALDDLSFSLIEIENLTDCPPITDFSKINFKFIVNK